MCGIVGVVSEDVESRFDRLVLQRMLDLIRHRGPDDQGVFESEGALIAMRRLSIIDLEGGHQPIANEDGSIWVVCNGEIYNYKQLRATLRSLGHQFRSQSDTEVIVHAYEEYGDEFLERLDGMFGLAVWDAKRRRLLIARDRVGIKPLYYASLGNTIAFCSEMKPLLQLPSMTLRTSSLALQEYLTLGHAVGPDTLLEGIKKLAPGHALVFENGRARLRCYWSLPQDVDHSRSTKDWVESVRAELLRSVRDHLVSDVPVGSFLSGGVDSSAIVALMARVGTEPVKTYSIGYSGDSVAKYYNELDYARAMAHRVGSAHREIVVRPNVAELLPKLMWHLEEPISDTAILTTYLVSMFAAQDVKVIMSGVGGDELFGGYPRYLGDIYGSRYRRLPSWIRNGLVRPLVERLPSSRSSRILDLARYAKEFVRADELDWKARYKSYVRLERFDVLSSLMIEAPAAMDGFDSLAADVRATDPLLRLVSLDLRTQLPEALLLLSDKMTMATSIECRVPFLDHKLIELAARAPQHVKLPNGRLKGLLKLALVDVLPVEVLQRKKRGFGAPMGAWLKRDLLGLRSALLSPSAVEQRGLLRSDGVREVCASHDSGVADYTDLLVVLMNLELWFRIFVDKVAPGDVAGELAERMEAA